MPPWPLVLIIVGLVLLFAEVFIPSGGILLILSLTAIVGGILWVFYTPESEGGGVNMGLITLGGVFVLMPAIVAFAFHLWPRTPMGKRLLLPGPEEDETIASLPEHIELEALKGQLGQTITPLHPSGVTLIQGRRIDSKTEGMYVEAGQWVKVIGVRAGQVTVRPLSEDEVGQLPEALA